MLWDPIRYAETCPSPDGARRRRAAWGHGGAMRSEPTVFAGKDDVSPQAEPRLRGRGR